MAECTECKKEMVKDDFGEFCDDLDCSAGKEDKKVRKKDSGKKVIGLNKERHALEIAIKNNFATLLIGETGMGKTYVLQSLGEELGKTVIRVSLNGEVGINELLGKWLVKDGSTYWQDGILIECMKKGWWIILDELNAGLPEVLFCLNSLMDDSKAIVVAEKDGERVVAHSEFRLFATINPPDEYVGTKELNKSLLSRFQIVLYLDYYAPSIELKIVRYQSKIDEKIGRIMVDVGNAIRQLKNKKKIWYTCSTRDLVNWARLFNCNGSTLEETFVFSILNKAHVDERELITSTIKVACQIDVDWQVTKGTVRSMTASLRKEVKELESKRLAMTTLLTDLESKTKELRGIL